MLPLNSQKIPQLYQDALRLQTSGRSDEAEAIYRQILAVRPNLAEALFQLGQIKFGQKSAAEAVEWFRRAAEAKPGEVAIWTAYAKAADMAGPSARSEFQTRLSGAPISPDAKLRLGAKSVPVSAPRGERNAIVKALQSRDFIRAERLSSQLLGSYPTDGVLWGMNAAALAAGRKTGAAARAFRQAVEHAPKHGETRLNHGRFLLEQRAFGAAADELREAAALLPRKPAPLQLLAEAEQKAGRPGDAAKTYAALAKLEPARETHRISLASCLIEDDRPDEAVRIFEKRAPRSVAALEAHANALKAAGREEDALAILVDGQSRHPEDTALMIGRADLLQRLGRFDEAEPLFRAAIALAPGNGAAYQAFFVTHKVKPDDPLLDPLTELFEAKDTPDKDRIAAGFALAKAMEDMKAHDRVFTYLKPANDLIRKAQPFDATAHRRDLEAIVAASEGTDFAARTVTGASDCAPIFVTGLPRSGTTLVESIIASHSDVTGGGELGFARDRVGQLLFGDGQGVTPLTAFDDAAIAEAGHDIATRFARLFPDAGRVTDKGVQSYTMIGPLLLTLPRARLILVERDPRDNLLSMYKNLFVAGKQRHSYDLTDLLEYYKNYRFITEHWQKIMPDRFHRIRYETLIGDPETEARALVAASGLDWQDQCLSFYENRRRVDTLSIHQVRQPIYSSSVGAWKRYEDDLAELISGLETAGYLKNGDWA